MDTYNPRGNKGDVFGVWGYAFAATLVEVLQRCGDDLTRENVMRQAASLDHVEIPLLLPGMTLTTGPDDYYPVEQLQLTRFDGKSWALFGDLINVE